MSSDMSLPQNPGIISVRIADKGAVFVKNGDFTSEQGSLGPFREA